LFHWINFACVLCLAAIGTALLYDDALGITDAGKLFLKTTHVWIGYVFVLNLLWRFTWAFIGNQHARWSAILPFRSGYLAECKSYIQGLIHSDARPYVGRNPIARAMVALLLVLLLLQSVTGLVLAGTDIYFPPFGHWITTWIAAPGADPSSIVPYNKTGIDPASWDAMRAFRSSFVIVHYWSFFALLLAVVIHIFGVVVTELREGGGIVSAMFTGRKVFDRRPVDNVDG
jgi:Ni/Fe-hydrogenase 1 B-type cytochrome subunit